MQAVHKFGHAIGAWATGGEVQRVVLHPLAISRTDLGRNPHPSVVVWSGPIIGVALPVIACAFAFQFGLRGSYVLRFFAGFCLIANGVYISAGSVAGVGDAGQMLRHGSAPWQLWLFGLATAPIGLWLWHRQGASFGLGPSGSEIDRAVAYIVLGVGVLLIGLGMLIGGDEREPVALISHL